jgi:uncharacterized membrane protein YhaH (DUF805 family)
MDLGGHRELVRQGHKQYVDFHGRARRQEYWMFTLFSVIISIVLGVIDNLLGTGSFSTSSGGGEIGVAAGMGLLGGIYWLAVLLPSLAVSVRRLHDTDRSGWWLLIALVPLVGAIVLLVFCALEGTRGPNRYGEDPKSQASAEAYHTP